MLPSLSSGVDALTETLAAGAAAPAFLITVRKTIVWVKVPIMSGRGDARYDRIMAEHKSLDSLGTIQHIGWNT